MARTQGYRAFLDRHCDPGIDWSGEFEDSVIMDMPKTNTAIATRALIVGLGETGLSCARYLAQQGVQLAITDSRQHPPALERVREQLPDVALFLGQFDSSVFANADMLVVSPGVPVATREIQQAKAAGIQVLGDVELFAQATATPVAAITGSNGKSTVTTLLGLMANAAQVKTAVGGNLGKPVLDLLDPSVALYVLELSSFQLETTHSLKPKVATVLNVSADHMDRYRDIDDYAGTKAGILAAAEVSVLNADDPRVIAMRGAGATLYFTLSEPKGDNWYGLRQIEGDTWLCHGDRALIRAGELLIPGRHNQANALASLAMGEALGLPMDTMLAVLRSFRGLFHRTEYVTQISGVDWYNDSKGTNPGACIAALEGLEQTDDSKTVLIAGGDCKQADFSELGPVLGRCARAVVLLGRDADQIARVMPADLIRQTAADMGEAVFMAAKLAQAGDRVLLSPACASFDMFDNYQHRGEVFKNAVGRLAS
jgi:UDP-N-acetylmuramoylalanine--D-glutamate ligase